MKERKEMIKRICDSLINYSEFWEIRDLSYYNKTADIAIWKTEPRVSYPVDIWLNYFERRKLKKAIDIFKYKTILSKLP